MNPKTKEFREQIANDFIKCLEEKEYAWKKGWRAASTIPQNAVTGARYNGVNRFSLTLLCMQKGYEFGWGGVQRMEYSGLNVCVPQF